MNFLLILDEEGFCYIGGSPQDIVTLKRKGEESKIKKKLDCTYVNDFSDHKFHFLSSLAPPKKCFYMLYFSGTNYAAFAIFTQVYNQLSKALS